MFINKLFKRLTTCFGRVLQAGTERREKSWTYLALPTKVMKRMMRVDATIECRFPIDGHKSWEREGGGDPSVQPNHLKGSNRNIVPIDGTNYWQVTCKTNEKLPEWGWKTSDAYIDRVFLEEKIEQRVCSLFNEWVSLSNIITSVSMVLNNFLYKAWFSLLITLMVIPC